MILKKIADEQIAHLQRVAEAGEKTGRGGNRLNAKRRAWIF